MTATNRGFLLLTLAAALASGQRLVLGLSGNGAASPTVYPGAPLVLEARLFSASGEPINLEVKGGAWTAALTLAVSAADGASPQWNFKPIGVAEPKVTLDGEQSVRLYWLLSPEDAAAAGAGTFEITLVADTTELAGAGAWKGKETSSPVRVTFKPEPGEWTPEDLNQRWLSLSVYHQLNGDLAASLSAVDTLLEKQPESVPAWVRKGEVQAAMELREEAAASLTKALQLFLKHNPKASHPPVEILRKLQELQP